MEENRKFVLSTIAKTQQNWIRIITSVERQEESKKRARRKQEESKNEDKMKQKRRNHNVVTTVQNVHERMREKTSSL